MLSCGAVLDQVAALRVSMDAQAAEVRTAGSETDSGRVLVARPWLAITG